MSQALCDQLALQNLGGTATAGIGGASGKLRSVEIGAPVRCKRFTFTIPASGPGSVAGDTILGPGLNVTDRIWGVTLYSPALGSGTTLAVGKQDSNNSANTDASHYLAAESTVTPVILQADRNIGEQVGVDPAGDQSTGNTTSPSAPGGGEGNGPVNILITIGGTPTAAVQIQGFVFYSSGQGV